MTPAERDAEVSRVRAILDAATPRTDDDGNPREGIATCGTCGRSWDDDAVSSLTPTPSARCPLEYAHEDPDDDPADDDDGNPCECCGEDSDNGRACGATRHGQHVPTYAPDDDDPPMFIVPASLHVYADTRAEAAELARDFAREVSRSGDASLGVDTSAMERD